MAYVIDHDIKVSNNSWGGGIFSQSLYDAIAASQAIGHIFVASAGNSGENIDDDPHYPASYSLPNIISVAATDNQDGLAVFPSGRTSCYGPESVDLGAPGLYVWSTTPVDSYGYKSGTSMAAPHVTGTVALVMSRWPEWPWTEVNERIMAAVRPVESLIGITVTGGVVNPAKVGDCNTNGIPDDLDIAGGTSEDCTGNGIPDECEPDCNNNGMADSCDVDAGTSKDCNANLIPDECEPDCNHNGTADSCDIRDATSPDCNENRIPDECEPGGLEDCNANGSPDLCDIHSGVSRDCDLNCVPDECEAQPLGRLYVDQNATTGANTGVTWADAYLDLHRALDHAACVEGEIAEVWVAEGTYTPDIRPTNRVDTFELPGGVAVYGGFAGGETSFGERDFSRNVTILSGDLDGDDELPGEPVVSDCCMEHDTPGCSHPVCASAVCSMTPSCCTDRWGVSCVYWSLFMCCDLCTSDNRCENSYHIVTASDTDAAAQLDGFTLRGGYAMHWCSSSGGAIRNLGGSLTLANCTFAENHAKYTGGAIENVENGALTLVNCVFNGNACVGSGGAMFSAASTATMVNCLFTGNTASSMGGAIFNWPDSDLHYTNCTFTENSARAGGAIYVYSPTNVTLTNCILWGNSDETLEGESEQIAYGEPMIDFSCIQGWSGLLGGTGNTGLDPLFVDYDGADNIAGTEDDNVRLSHESPCVDAGDNTAVPPWVTVDLDGLQRFVDLPGVPDSGNGTPPIVDMGAYERGIDCNGNDISDEADIALGTSQDCNDNAIPDECEPDSDHDGVTDDCDLCPGFDDSEDADGDGVPDGCDGCPYESALTMPTEPEFELTCDDGVDNDCDGVVDENDPDCSCELVESPLAEPGGVEKNRYIAFTDGNPDRPTAVRVRFVDLPAPFDVYNDQTMWIGESREVTENAGYVDPADVPSWPTFWTATLQCEPHYKFWGTDAVHIYHELIVPGGRYEVQAIDPACDTAAEENYSLPFEQRSSIWGDFVKDCTTTPCGPPDGIVNVATDVTALLDKYKNLPEAVSKVRADIEGCAVGNCPVPDQVINITDVTYSLNAFLGETYPPAGFPEPSVPPACPP